MRRAYLKSVLSSLLISSTLFVAPLSIYADHTGEHTIEQLKVQINALLAQVVALQQQLGSSSSGGSSTASSCPRLAFNFYLGVADSTTDGQVSQLQRILAADAEVYPEARITGYYGPLTEQAVRRFQKKHGIVSSGSPQTTGYGVVGPATRIKLLQRCQPTSLPSPTAAWKTYTNSKFNFSLNYLKDLVVSEGIINGVTGMFSAILFKDPTYTEEGVRYEVGKIIIFEGSSAIQSNRPSNQAYYVENTFINGMPATKYVYAESPSVFFYWIEHNNIALKIDLDKHNIYPRNTKDYIDINSLRFN